MFKKTKIRYLQKVALCMAFLIAFQAAFPVMSYALTSGPTQPEFNSFEPVGTTQMVDLFSGDFTYNIPLFELPGPDGGYPFNLAYHSGITMDQEASWVGLGWSMNHGAITRSMRGFPDDFEGDEVTKRLDMKDNRTHTFTAKAHVELWGYEDQEKVNIDGEDFITNPGQSGNASLNFALSVIDNSYKGIGISTSAGINSQIFQAANGNSFSAGLGLGINSMEGASLNPSLSFSAAGKNATNSFSLSSNINSREGLNSISLGISRPYTLISQNEEGYVTDVSSTSRSSGSSYSFAKSSYSPQVTMPYASFNLTAGVELGGWTGVAGLGLGADYSFMRQQLKDKPDDNFVTRSAPAYGFFNMKNRTSGSDGMSDDALLDFNREKEGPLNKYSPNLPNPITTPDIYAVKGQGVGGSYQAFRSDIGILTDPIVHSNGGGFTVGVEGNFGPGFDLGVDLGGNWSFSRNRKWVADNNSFSALQYKGSILGSDYEPFYFKAAGEMTAEPSDTYADIGGERAVKIDRDGMGVDPKLNVNGTNADIDFSNIFDDGKRLERKTRANSIQHITNKELLADNDVEILPEYRIMHYNTMNNYDDPPAIPYSRTSHPEHHVAGITALQPGGSRYVYALPVKNIVQDEVVFSVDGSAEGCTDGIIEVGNSIVIDGDETLDPAAYRTGVPQSDDYYSHTTLPEYTHSYLLTSVLGADYVDIDGIPGPSDGDIGYWVKFNYIKTNSDYGWRAPFSGANLLKGRKSIDKDDKAAFSYGEREQYYLATAETRTHLAKFNMDIRNGDGRGAQKRFQNNDEVDPFGFSYKLQNIELFSKLELENNSVAPVPMKTVHFDYAATGLCDGVMNGGGSKLTLEKVHFTYENSNRGALSPYIFEYAGENPDYNNYQYDRWGNYNPIDICTVEDFPYTPQNSQVDADKNTSAWHLTNITLPSGAEMVIDYESDDYGYVQDKVAMQMFKLNGVGVFGTNNFSPEASADRKIYFPLETSLGLNPDPCDIKPYIEDLHGIQFLENDPCTIDPNHPGQIYFKVLIDLLDSDSDENNEFVEGYAHVKDYGIEDANTGWIELKPTSLGGTDYHPFVAAAWQTLKLEFSDKMHGENLNDNDGDFGAAINRFASVSKEIVNIFSSFYTTCKNKDYARDIVLNKSMIRLNTPDKKKFGGGNRVKQITLYDNVDATDDSTYGQTFEYTTEDKDGNTISSGVATNEPAIGNEECALRYAKEYTNNAFLKSDENLFFEYPINESYYPGASVGYSKVTVKSIATAEALGDEPINTPANLPTGFGTTGITVNEFYTAKDFPVLVEETLNDSKTGSPNWIPFGLGELRFDDYTASQGYAIILNDMHGKPYKVAHYGLDKNNDLIPEKINEVVYTYAEGEKKVQSPDGNMVAKRTLDNEVKVLLSNQENSGEADMAIQQLGVDYEFFTDVRESKVDAGQIYIGFNVEFVTPFIFGIVGWPRLSINDSKTRTAVTNKVIRKSGILIRTDAYDGQSHITTSNEVFDPLTGQPLLTTVNNNYDDLVYSYNIPARYAYEGMGAAADNWGLKFKGAIGDMGCCKPYYMVSPIWTGQTSSSLLCEGDEFIVWNGETNTEKTKATLMMKGDNGTLYLDFDDIGSLGNMMNLTFFLIRSGKRNHLSVSAGSVVAKANPTEGRTANNELVSVPIPDGIATSSPSSNITVPYSTINSVLNASAVTYCDEWAISDTCDLTVIGQYQTPPPSTCLWRVSITGGCIENCDPRYSISYMDESGNLVSQNVFGCPDEDYVFTYDPQPFTANEGTYLSCGIGTPGPWTVTVTTEDCPQDGCFTNNGDNYIESMSNPYQTGERGIWRPQKTYTYIENRDYGTTDITSQEYEFDLKTQGTFDGLPLFDWQNPFFTEASIADKWVLTNESTQYNNTGEATESKNVLCQYSSAIYGYNDNVPIAVGANVRQLEMGFEGFENFPNLVSAPILLNEGNIDFAIKGGDAAGNIEYAISETYNIIGGFLKGNQGQNQNQWIWIDKPYSGDFGIPDEVVLRVANATGKEFTVIATVHAVHSLDYDGDNCPQSMTALELNEVVDCELISGEIYTGKVLMKTCEDFKNVALTSLTNPISETEVHSGQKSLKTLGSKKFTQKTLDLQDGKEYFLSCWVKRDGGNAPTYDDGTLSIDVDLASSSINLVPSGKVIEGWQKIEGEFMFEDGAWSLEFHSGSQLAYFDDLRIFPKHSNIQTYVYDPLDYELRATLDNNNYATFYRYDEEGNLFLLKKETEKGIKTIQETRGYVSDNQ